MGVPLSRTFSTALVRAHKAGDAWAQNDKKGVRGTKRNPPGSATVCVCVSMWGGADLSPKDLGGSHGTVVGTLLSRVAQLWPAKRVAIVVQ